MIAKQVSMKILLISFFLGMSATQGAFLVAPSRTGLSQRVVSSSAIVPWQQHHHTKLYVSSKSLPPPSPPSSLEDLETSSSSSSTPPLPQLSTTAATPPTSPAAVFGHPLGPDTLQRNKDMVHFIKSLLFDQLFAGDSRERGFARFYALETIARMPYFSYLSVLHLLETLGKWRRADYLKLHFCQSWNELHHLLIMEELGGSQRWSDRWVAQHVAFLYYWFAVTAYLINPTWAYNLNQAVEEEAYATYDAFLQQNEEWLRTQPAPEVAKAYYRDGELYLFDGMHLDTTTKTFISNKEEEEKQQRKFPWTSSSSSSSSSPAATAAEPEKRRPRCDSLYDVILAIRDDEMEHVKTMKSLQEGA